MNTTKLAIVLVGTIPLAVYAGGAVQTTRVEVDPTPATTEPSATTPSVDVDLNWDASSAHGVSRFLLSGEGVRIEKSFDTGSAPSFDVGAAQLAPGLYSYRLEFEPNGVRQDTDTLEAIQAFEATYRAEREQLSQAGQREAVRQLDATWARKVAEASEVQGRLQDGYADAYVVERGQFLVDERGNASAYDQEAFLREEHEVNIAARRAEPTFEEEGEEVR